MLYATTSGVGCHSANETSQCFFGRQCFAPILRKWCQVPASKCERPLLLLCFNCFAKVWETSWRWDNGNVMITCLIVINIINLSIYLSSIYLSIFLFHSFIISLSFFFCGLLLSILVLCSFHLYLWDESLSIQIARALVRSFICSGAFTIQTRSNDYMEKRVGI